MAAGSIMIRVFPLLYLADSEWDMPQGWHTSALTTVLEEVRLEINYSKDSVYKFIKLNLHGRVLLLIYENNLYRISVRSQSLW